MPIRRILLWTALALAGLLVAVGVTTAATSLTSQRVGLQAEPLDAGDSLAPRPRRTSTPEPKASPTATADPSPSPSAGPGEEEGDDHRGRGDDDD